MTNPKTYELDRALLHAADAAKIACANAADARRHGTGTVDLDAAATLAVRKVLTVQSDYIDALLEK